MKKSRWFNPYITTASGKLKPALKDCWTCAEAGVYLIKNIQSDSIVYVGSSTTQLKKTIYRHFQEWNDRQKVSHRQYERKVYPKTGYYQVRFFKCTAAQALRLEKYLIIKLQPKDNPLKYDQLKMDMPAAEKIYKAALAADTIVKADYLEDAPF